MSVWRCRQSPHSSCCWRRPASGRRLRRVQARTTTAGLILTIEDGRNPTPAELNLLIGLARNEAVGNVGLETRRLAIRALGRLERRELIPVLARLLDDRTASDAAEVALVLVLRAHGDFPDPEIEAAR